MEDLEVDEDGATNNSARRIILEGFFNLYGKNTFVYLILVENYGLLYSKLKTREAPSFRKVDEETIDLSSCFLFQELSWRDIVGCQCMRGLVNATGSRKSSKNNSQQNSDEGSSRDESTDGKSAEERAYICIFAYPKTRKRFSKGLKRQRISLTLAINEEGTFRDNLSVAENWREAIRKCITGCLPSSVLPSKKHLLVFVNPHSGPGKALSIFKHRIAPVLTEASITYDLVITQRQNHAYDLVKEAELSKWHGIVVVAGDGLIFEVINGIMTRPDWSTAIRMPIGVVPGGSGNGLAAAINHALGESLNTNPQLLSAFNLAKGRIIPMDLVRVELPGSTVYSFLAIAWGIVADIDIESERLRSIGDTRFTLWAIPRIANLRVYRGRLSYLPAPGYKPSAIKNHHPNAISKMLSRSTSSYEHKTKHVNMRNANSVDDLSAVSHDDDEDVLPHPNLVRIESVDGLSPSLQNGHQNEPSSATLQPTLLQPLHRPVPSSWVQTEDDFIMVCVVYQTHIGSNVYMVPNAALDDGLMWLMIIRRGPSRSQILQFLLALDNGSHVDYPWIELIPIRAFRLEPMTEHGHLTVDGELVNYGPIQAEVMPSVARILTH